MKNKSIKSKVIAGVLMASMMASTSAVFAADTTDTTDSTNNATTQEGYFNGRDHKYMFKGGFNGGEHKDMFKTDLADLVTAGTITSDEQTAIETALTSAKDGDFQTALTDLVTAGTITSTRRNCYRNCSYSKRWF